MSIDEELRRITAADQLDADAALFAGKVAAHYCHLVEGGMPDMFAAECALAYQEMFLHRHLWPNQPPRES